MNTQIINGQTPLERFGMAMRENTLMRNKWGNNGPYTKFLVSHEYQIQKEFFLR